VLSASSRAAPSPSVSHMRYESTLGVTVRVDAAGRAAAASAPVSVGAVARVDSIHTEDTSIAYQCLSAGNDFENTPNRPPCPLLFLLHHADSLMSRVRSARRVACALTCDEHTRAKGS
jgi:hypothetical protein